VSWRCNPVHCCNTLGLMRRSSGRALQAIPVVATRCSALQNRKRLSPAARCATDNVAAIIRRRNCPQANLCDAAAQRSALRAAVRWAALRWAAPSQSPARSQVGDSCPAQRTEPCCNTQYWVATRCTGLQHVVLSVAAYSVQHAPYTTQDATDSVQDTVCKIQRTAAIGHGAAHSHGLSSVHTAA
jgi:hypothetical protein